MRKLNYYCFTVLLLLTSACAEKKTQVEEVVEPKPELVLPFQELVLNDLKDFKKASDDWKIVGEVFVDRSKDKVIRASDGSGILLNNPENEKGKNLVTTFEHGDIEFECDVMLPVQSNSGIYFQERYEVQLFDSWGVKDATYGDMGGVYQRWDDSKGEGEKGFEGFAPIVNAAKAPGLWQHLKVIFHAPRFDEDGNKTDNARFEKITLNGALIHENIELSGPTRGGKETEVTLAPLMIQGDHGPVAFRNIKYKLYTGERVQLVDVVMKEYENANPLFPNLDSLIAIREVPTDSIAATMATGDRPQKLLSYTGKLKVPTSGDYIFDYKLNRAGGALLINADTIVSMNGNFSLDSLGIGKVALEKGEVPFQILYNKHVPWQRGFGLYVEGPGIQRHKLHAESSLVQATGEINTNYLINPSNETVTQRSFWNHRGKKRTHCISVGHPSGINYTYDLETGSLLQAWSGDFMNATKMWQGRGEKQLGEPLGFVVSLHGDPEFAILNENDAIWPKVLSKQNFKQMGYELDTDRSPIFLYQINGASIKTQIFPKISYRGLNREITIKTEKVIWHKVAEGESIAKLPDGTFVVNDESYFIDFDSGSELKPEVRKNNMKEELVVKIPSGSQQLNYSIIW